MFKSTFLKKVQNYFEANEELALKIWNDKYKRGIAKAILDIPPDKAMPAILNDFPWHDF